jgi:hypothetical protein
MTPTREQAEVIEATRPDFERYFLESRKSKGANRRPTFARFPDDTYQDDHTQRHRWTWQQSAMAARAQALEDAATVCGNISQMASSNAPMLCAEQIRALKGKQ